MREGGEEPQAFQTRDQERYLQGLGAGLPESHGAGWPENWGVPQDQGLRAAKRLP